MGTRGLWNLRVKGKWYHYSHRLGRTSSPGEERTFQRIKQLQTSSGRPGDEWHPVPFQSPLHINTNYVYTIDLDAGHLVVWRWEGSYGALIPVAFQISLEALSNASDLNFESLQRTATQPTLNGSTKPLEPNTGMDDYKSLNVEISTPTPLNELQYRLFTDLVFQWRFYIDDHSIWKYPSPLFKTLSIAFLRLASWDLEISFDDDVKIPLTFTSVPLWEYPENDIYWFHGFLVVLCEDLSTEASPAAAVARAETFLTTDRRSQAAFVILMSLRHVVFVELSRPGKSVSCSRAFPLLTNTSSLQCSPGFRVLTYIFTALKFKAFPFAGKESGAISLPPEILRMVCSTMSPKDLVSFCRASFIAEELYYAMIPQFGDLQVCSFERSIPCCGKQAMIKDDGICCSSCYAWRHARCEGLEESPSTRFRYLCSDCRENEMSFVLEPGGVYRTSGRKDRGNCRVKADGDPLLFKHRTSMPSKRRPEIVYLSKNLADVPQLQIDYTVRFSGDFSGLAYGLDKE